MSRSIFRLDSTKGWKSEALSGEDIGKFTGKDAYEKVCL
jgi:hypothetical protein